MLDVMCGGRLVAGMVIGGGPEYFSYQVNPTHARERFREALDLIVKAWTTPGPFLWNSKHYFFRYVNPWPRPLQQPHPPIWIPGVGSLETIEFVAQRRYAYMGIPYFHIDVFRRVFGLFREACEKAGYTADPGADGLGRADLRRRDRRAGPRGVRAALLVLRHAICSRASAWRRRATRRRKSALAILKNRGTFLAEQKTWDDIEKGVFAIVGSPETVRQKLEHYQKELGVGVVLTGCQTGTLPHELARKSMELLAPRGAAACSRPAEETASTAPACFAVAQGRRAGDHRRRRPADRRSCTAATVRRSSTCTARSANRCCGCRSTRPGRSTSASTSPTHPGFGKSGGFDQIDTIEDMAFHYVELFDALGLERGDPGRRQSRRLDRGRVRRALAGARQEAVDRRPRRACGSRSSRCRTCSAIMAGPRPPARLLFHDPRRLHGDAGHRATSPTRSDAGGAIRR